MNEFAIHYHLIPHLHEMNAKTLNQCEARVIAIIEQILETLELNFEPELVVRTEGGIVDILTLKPKTPFDRAVVEILKQSLSGIITGLIVYAITKSPTTIRLDEQQFQQLIDTLKEDAHNCTPAQTKEEQAIYERRQELANTIAANVSKFNEDENIKKTIQKEQSGLYRKLDSDTSVLALSVDFPEEMPEGQRAFVEQEKVDRQNFSNFVIGVKNLDPIVDRNAVIKIISPVLNENGHYKWRGDYNGATIEFFMTDKEIRLNIARGLIKFGADSLMSGVLTIYRKRNEGGEEVITGYSMKEVFEIVQENGGVLETNKGRRERRRALEENQPQQTLLFENP